MIIYTLSFTWYVTGRLWLLHHPVSDIPVKVCCTRFVFPCALLVVVCPDIVALLYISSNPAY
jgi:hypothetical protein